MYIGISLLTIRGAPIGSRYARYIESVSLDPSYASMGKLFRLIVPGGYASIVLEKTLRELYRSMLMSYPLVYMREVKRLVGVIVTRGEYIDRFRRSLESLGTNNVLVFYSLVSGAGGGFGEDVSAINEYLGSANSIFSENGVSGASIAAAALGEEPSVFIVLHSLHGDEGNVVDAVIKLKYMLSSSQRFTLRRPIYIGFTQ